MSRLGGPRRAIAQARAGHPDLNSAKSSTTAPVSALPKGVSPQKHLLHPVSPRREALQVDALASKRHLPRLPAAVPPAPRGLVPAAPRPRAPRGLAAGRRPPRAAAQRAALQRDARRAAAGAHGQDGGALAPLVRHLWPLRAPPEARGQGAHGALAPQPGLGAATGDREGAEAPRRPHPRRSLGLGLP